MGHPGSNSQSISIFQESDSGRFSFANQEELLQAEYFPTECIFGSILQVKVNQRNYKFYTNVVKLITIQVWRSYLKT